MLLKDVKNIKEVVLTGNDLSLEELVAVSRYDAKIKVDPDAIDRIKASRALIDDIVDNERVVYGVTTGFGSLCRVSISKEDCSQLQENLIRTHSCGYGNPLSREVTRAAMLIRANALVKGYSGIRLETLNVLVDMINKGVHPYIPEKGSLGASGDLAPLAHMVLPMLGLGDAGSPASDSTLGPTSGLNADGQHNHIWDTCVPTFIFYDITLLIGGVIGAMILG